MDGLAASCLLNSWIYTDNFQKMQTIKQYMYIYNLFFVDDSKILHFTSPVAIVITTSELRPIIIEGHTTMKTL